MLARGFDSQPVEICLRSVCSYIILIFLWFVSLLSKHTENQSEFDLSIFWYPTTS